MKYKFRILESNNKKPYKVNWKSVYVTIPEIRHIRTFPKHILACEGWWWTQSPAKYRNEVYCVDCDGRIAKSEVDEEGYVRPILLLNQSMNDGDIIEVFGRHWYCQGKIALLLGNPLVKMLFRENYEAYDANLYGASDVCDFIYGWAREQKKRSSKK